MLDDLADAADLGGAGDGVGVDDAEAEIGVEECVHHDAVAELEDLEREDGAGEEHQREWKQRKLHHVVGPRGVGVMLLRERRSRAREVAAAAAAVVVEDMSC